MINMKEILSFSGEYAFLSNFYPCTILYEGILYPSTEHAYVAAKTENIIQRKHIAKIAFPGQAKKFGKTLVLRDNWDTIRLSVMMELLIQKFSQEPFDQWLLDTEDAFIEEGNTWGDKFWGTVNGVGENHLGKLIMEIRSELVVIKSLEHFEELE